MWWFDHLDVDSRTWTQRYAANVSRDEELGDFGTVFDLAVEPFSTPDVLVSGMGPDLVPLPDLEAGTWRTCVGVPNGDEQIGCLVFDIEHDSAASGSAPAQVAFDPSGRSYMAFSATEPDGALVRVDLPDSATVESARVEVFADGRWEEQETVAVRDNGLIEIPNRSDALRRLCFPSLGPDVACVLVPPHIE